MIVFLRVSSQVKFFLKSVIAIKTADRLESFRWRSHDLLRNIFLL